MAATTTKLRLPLLDDYLREQGELTAVERFARRHASGLAERTYEDLLPASPPGEGQQYAFRVDLDACTACKACVTACHNLNGLDAGETWRSVGLLHGGTAAAPVMQTVTSACHHCLDPACMYGCPVNAYEKDPKTGIVAHLDDQCIGCQYCTFTCPYEAPQYNAARGIVRKCDMCRGRLEAGEAPACVQACPNGAIAITVVDAAQAIEDAQAGVFLPGAPSPEITLPTTIYETKRPLPRNLLPGDFFAVAPSRNHAPLVVMLVLTQLSVGAFVVDVAARPWLPADVEPLHAAVAVGVGLAALGASILHLGRPLYAFRAFLGLRTSWMSREIVAFGLFAPLAIAHAASSWLGLPRVHDALGPVVAAVGALGIACSALIYHATRRRWWTVSITAPKFFLTAALLGLATAIVTSCAGGAADLVRALSRLVAATSVTKGLFELALLHHLAEKRQTDLKRSAILLTTDLAWWSVGRFAALAAGGVALPLLHAGGRPSLAAALASLALLVVGEMLERTLFFAASSSRGMPKGPR